MVGFHAARIWSVADRGHLAIHDISLALWDEPIGELWDLEELSEMCK